MSELERIESAKENFKKYGLSFKPRIVRIEEIIEQINLKGTVR